MSSIPVVKDAGEGDVVVVEVEEEIGKEIGCQLWEAGTKALCTALNDELEFFLSQAPGVESFEVLELGAGVGSAGIFAAKYLLQEVEERFLRTQLTIAPIFFSKLTKL